MQAVQLSHLPVLQIEMLNMVGFASDSQPDV